MLEREKTSFLAKGHFLSVASFLLLFCLFAFFIRFGAHRVDVLRSFSLFLLLLSLFYIYF